MADSHCSFKVEAEEPLNSKPHLIRWSMRRDLAIAASEQTSSVSLHRMSWERPWRRLPPQPHSRVADLTWHPTSVMIAVCYTSGQVVLLEADQGNPVMTHELGDEARPTCTMWTGRCVPALPHPDAFAQLLLQPITDGDVLAKFIRSDATTAIKDTTDVLQEGPSALVVGCETSRVVVYAYGVLPVLDIDINGMSSHDCGSVISVNISESLGTLFALCSYGASDNENSVTPTTLTLVAFSTEALALGEDKIRDIALKCVQIDSALTLVSLILDEVEDTWSTISDDFAILITFKDRVDNSEVGSEFAQLLCFGKCSEKLQQHLEVTLGEKGVKASGDTIKSACATALAHLVNKLKPKVTELCVHADQLRAMAEWTEKYGSIGLCPRKTRELRDFVGCFHLQVARVERALNMAMDGFAQFHAWLTVTVRQFSAVGEDASKDTEGVGLYEVSRVMDFLEGNLMAEGSDSACDFYKKGSLVGVSRLIDGVVPEASIISPPISDEDRTFMDSVMRKIGEHKFKRYTILLRLQEGRTSLCAIMEDMRKCLKEVTAGPTKELTNQVKLLYSVVVPQEDGFASRALQFITQTLRDGQGKEVDLHLEKAYTVLVDTERCSLHLIRSTLPALSGPSASAQPAPVLVSPQIALLSFTTLPKIGSAEENGCGTSYRVVDIAYYREGMVCVVLDVAPEGDDSHESTGRALVHLRLGMLPETAWMDEVPSKFPYDAGMCVLLEDVLLVPQAFEWISVSGERRLGSLMASTRRRLRLLTLDDAPEEEEEEEEEEEGLERSTAEDKIIAE